MELPLDQRQIQIGARMDAVVHGVAVPRVVVGHPCTLVNVVAARGQGEHVHRHAIGFAWGQPGCLLAIPRNGTRGRLRGGRGSGDHAQASGRIRSGKADVSGDRDRAGVGNSQPEGHNVAGPRVVAGPRI